MIQQDKTTKPRIYLKLELITTWRGWYGENEAPKLNTAAHNGYISFGYPFVRLVPEGERKMSKNIFSRSISSVVRNRPYNVTSVNITCIKKFLNVLLELLYLKWGSFNVLARIQSKFVQNWCYSSSNFWFHENVNNYENMKINEQ